LVGWGVAVSVREGSNLFVALGGDVVSVVPQAANVTAKIRDMNVFEKLFILFSFRNPI